MARSLCPGTTARFTYCVRDALFSLDTLLLGYWKGDCNAGIYQAAMKLMALVLVVPDILWNARQLVVVALSIVYALVVVGWNIHSIAVAVPLIVLFFLLVPYFIGYSAEERSLVFALPRRLSLS